MKFFKKAINIIKYLSTGILAILIFIIIFVLSPALWNRWITYPKLEKERAEIWSKYQKPEKYIEKEDYQGVLHAHTYWSHDSRGTLPEIVSGAKQANLDFIFFSDHAHGKMDTFPRSFHGIYEGIIMEAGTESSNGLMVNPFDSTILDWNVPTDQLIRQVVHSGGFVGYVHTEKEHDWQNPDYQAMEIYNIHTDLEDEEGILPFLINNMVNGKKFKHWCYRELYDEQTAILSNWDELNLQRQIVGFGAVDAHNNQSFRARYLENGKVEWVGPNADALVIRTPNWLDKLLLDDPDEFGWAYKWELDPYFESFNFVNNHVFCDKLTNTNIREHVVKGHLFVSFESLAPAKGFQYFAQNDRDSVTAILGDSVMLKYVDVLKGVSPFPVKFELFKDGKSIEESREAYEFKSNSIDEQGNYRLVARLRFGKEWIPWIYTNPIYVYNK